MIEEAMTFAVQEYDDELAVACLVWLGHYDQAALGRACDVCLSYTYVDLASAAGRSGCWPECYAPTSSRTRRRSTPTRSRRWRAGPRDQLARHRRAVGNHDSAPSRAGGAVGAVAQNGSSVCHQPGCARGLGEPSNSG